MAELPGVASLPSWVSFAPLLQGLADFTKPTVCCAANLSYAALQLNDDLQFSHSVYGLGSGTPCSVLLSLRGTCSILQPAKLRDPCFWPWHVL